MRLIGGVVAVLLLAGCGGTDESDPDEAGVVVDASAYPDCAEVWHEGGTLPEDYEGCMSGGDLMAAVSYECGDGRSLLSSPDEDLFAYGGGTIEDVAGYSAAFDECVAD